MKKAAIKWTKPYFGIRHIDNIPRSHQITVTELSNGKAEAFLLHLHGITPYTRVKTFFGELTLVISTAEKWAKEMDFSATGRR
jgi:hypothetical protein